MNQKRITIAIDGFSACGKSTLAKDLAKQLGYVFIDSGAMYRAAALYCLRQHLIQDGELDKTGIDAQLSQMDIHFEAVAAESHIFLNGQDVSHEIREPKVAEIVSIVAAYKPIREKLVEAQQKMGVLGGIVMDGRDIGTVVFPDAILKVYLTATPRVRAERRVAEAGGVEGRGRDGAARLGAAACARGGGVAVRGAGAGARGVAGRGIVRRDHHDVFLVLGRR